MARHTYLTMMTPAEARELWFSHIDALKEDMPEESVPLSAALHRVLSRPVEALRSSPAFHGAAMDGIAVKAEDTFTASSRRPLRLEIGKNAFWINTGHPLPEGCNAVIMVEHVNLEDGGKTAVIEKAAFPWQHVRKLGEDMVATEIILAPGVVIGPYELGALAAGGVTHPMVFAKPRVAVIPSGSEIVALDEAKEEDLRAGRALPEFNSLIFSAMLKQIKLRNGDIVLVQIPGKVMEVFNLLGFSQLFNFKDSLGAAESFFKQEDSRDSSVFPKVFSCPVCSKRLKTSGLGRFRCSECKSILAVDEKGQVTVG